MKSFIATVLLVALARASPAEQNSVRRSATYQRPYAKPQGPTRETLPTVGSPESSGQDATEDSEGSFVPVRQPSPANEASRARSQGRAGDSHASPAGQAIGYLRPQDKYVPKYTKAPVEITYKRPAHVEPQATVPAEKSSASSTRIEQRARPEPSVGYQAPSYTTPRVTPSAPKPVPSVSYTKPTVAPSSDPRESYTKPRVTPSKAPRPSYTKPRVPPSAPKPITYKRPTYRQPQGNHITEKETKYTAPAMKPAKGKYPNRLFPQVLLHSEKEIGYQRPSTSPEETIYKRPEYSYK